MATYKAPIATNPTQSILGEINPETVWVDIDCQHLESEEVEYSYTAYVELARELYGYASDEPADRPLSHLTLEAFRPYTSEVVTQAPDQCGVDEGTSVTRECVRKWALTPYPDGTPDPLAGTEFEQPVLEAGAMMFRVLDALAEHEFTQEEYDQAKPYLTSYGANVDVAKRAELSRQFICDYDGL